MAPQAPSRGQIWWLDLGNSAGTEIKKDRPAVVISVDAMNGGSSGLCIVVPLTTTIEPVLSCHVRLAPQDAKSFGQEGKALCEQVKSVSRTRLRKQGGRLSTATIDKIVDVVKVLIG